MATTQQAWDGNAPFTITVYSDGDATVYMNDILEGIIVPKGNPLRIFLTAPTNFNGHVMVTTERMLKTASLEDLVGGITEENRHPES